jgi:cytidine diphosphoramidate kinase
MIVWIIGKSSVGKSTIGKLLTENLNKSSHSNVMFIDGDIFRELMGNDLGHSVEDRYKNAKRIENFCVYMDQQNVNVVFALLSIFPEVQRSIRSKVKNYYQIYLKASEKALKSRDTKGVYKNNKNIVGMDIKFPEPYQSDLIIENQIEDDLYPKELAEYILQFLEKNLINDY